MNDIAETVFTDILPVFQHMMNDIQRNVVAVFRFYAASVKIFDYIVHFFAVGVTGKRFENVRRGVLVYFKAFLFR